MRLTRRRVEKDCTEWAHQQVKVRLGNLEVAKEGRTVTVGKVTKVEGDVTVSQRKGKLRHNFDLNITLPWACPETKEKGTAEIKDFMSDTDLKGFEFCVRPDAGTTVQPETKAFMLAAVKETVWRILQEVAGLLLEEQGKTLLVAESPVAEGSPTDQLVAEEFKKGVLVASSKAHTGFSTWKEKVSFKAPPSEVFRTLTDVNRIRVWSRGPVEGSLDQPGAAFKLFNGAVSGTILERDAEACRLKMSWRLSGWAPGAESIVEMGLSQTGSADTELLMSQTGIPSDQFEATSKNWTNYYWNPIKAIFGFGAFPQF